MLRRMISLRSVRMISATRIKMESAQIDKIVNDISLLNLLETADLVKALKLKLNIQDIMMPSAPSSAPATATAVVEEVKEVAAEKTSFTIKLESFEASAKAKLIREIKTLIPGSNLVEAKKFVESVPKVIRENVTKEEAQKIKAHLESLGGVVLLE